MVPDTLRTDLSTETVENYLALVSWVKFTIVLMKMFNLLLEALMKRISMLSALLGVSLVASNAWAYDCNFNLVVLNKTKYNLYVAPRLGADGTAVGLPKGSESAALTYTASNEVGSRDILVYTVIKDMPSLAGILKYDYSYEGAGWFHKAHCSGIRASSVSYTANPTALNASTVYSNPYGDSGTITVTLTGG